jgi:uncharacterized protein
LKIYVNAIPPEGMELEGEVNPSELNIETAHAHFASPIKVKAYITRDKDIITVGCDITSSEKQVCARCLSEFEYKLNKHDNFIYEVTARHIIELDDNIKDAIILDYPIKMLCRPDCKGLCAYCGKNQNEGPCDCRGE